MRRHLIGCDACDLELLLGLDEVGLEAWIGLQSRHDNGADDVAKLVNDGREPNVYVPG
jgi:hypothetical protein